MPMFAKLFGPDHDQVLVKLDSNDDGAPEIRLYFEAPDLGVFQVALNYQDTADGWATAEASFAKMDEAEARRGVAAALAELAPAR